MKNYHTSTFRSSNTTNSSGRNTTPTTTNNNNNNNGRFLSSSTGIASSRGFGGRGGGVVVVDDDVLDGRRSPRTVTATSSSLSPSFKLRPATAFPLPKTAARRSSKSIPLLPDVENNVNSSIFSTGDPPSNSMELLKLMMQATKGGASLMSCSYNTMQKHYDNDTLRMYQRITKGRRQRTGTAGPATTTTSTSSSCFIDIDDTAPTVDAVDQYQEGHEDLGIATSTSPADHHLESDDYDDDAIFEMDL
jgi:hypothetical protein